MATQKEIRDQLAELLNSVDDGVANEEKQETKARELSLEIWGLTREQLQDKARELGDRYPEEDMIEGVLYKSCLEVEAINNATRILAVLPQSLGDFAIEKIVNSIKFKYSMNRWRLEESKKENEDEKNSKPQEEKGGEK